MARRTIFEINYDRFKRVLGREARELEFDRAYRFRASGFMDLVVERLPDCGMTGAPVVALCHYFEQNGDLCRDPEMTVRVFEPKSVNAAGMIEALTFEQSIPPIYQQVYPEPGKVRPQLKKDLNAFLGTWLRNLEQQGHRPVSPEN